MIHVPAAVIALAWAAVSCGVYAILACIIRGRRYAALAREWGTQEPVRQKNRLPFGVDWTLRMLKADREQRFPTDLIQRVRDVGGITIKHHTLGTPTLFTADEKNIQAVLATQFHDFDLGPVRRGNFMPLLGNGIFTQDGKEWERSRAMMRPQFSRELVSDLDLEERHVQNLMKHLVVNTADGWTDEIDLQVLFFRLTLDSATEFLFGKAVDSQIASLPSSSPLLTDSFLDEQTFAYAFDQGQMILATRTRLQTLYPFYNPPSFRKCREDCHSFIDHFVRLALSKTSNEKKEPEKVDCTSTNPKYVFLDALVTQTRDPAELRSQLLNILLAGRDTTASLLGWLFYSLTRDPARYAKLRAILLRDFGTYEKPTGITFARLKGCTYLQHCMNESLRLYPVVPVNSRTANKDTTLPRGGGLDGTVKVLVPKGMAVEYSVHVMHHREDIWGSDVEQFIPERWEGRKVGWEFLPFNGGPRICIGQQFALTETSYVTVRLLQRFAAMENRDFKPVRHNLTLTNCSGNGVRVRLREQ